MSVGKKLSYVCDGNNMFQFEKILLLKYFLIKNLVMSVTMTKTVTQSSMMKTTVHWFQTKTKKMLMGMGLVMPAKMTLMVMGLRMP